MKHLLITLLAISSLTASAISLSPDEALSRALSPNAAKAPGAAAPYSLAFTAYAGDRPAVYAFTRTDAEGFIIAPAESSAPPILGYGSGKFHDEFGEIAPACQYWLDELAAQVAFAAANHATRSSDSSWRPEREAIEPMCQTLWGQGSPFYNMCPTLNGRYCYTGCAATSMAQIMKYHNWPERGEGSFSYEWNGETLSIDFSETEFDWDNMRDSYTTSATSEQKNAVALLMKACGYAIQMDYSPYGSGAIAFYQPQALAQYFRYNKEVKYLEREWYSKGAWEELVYNSLANYGPVIYNGQSGEGGHSFVCDGYAGDGYFHINWGWNGMSDGYFLLDALDPDEQGEGGTSSGYNYYQDIICDIRPDRDGTSQYDPILYLYNALSISAGSGSKIATVNSQVLNPGPATPTNHLVGLKLVPVSSQIDNDPTAETYYVYDSVEGEWPMLAYVYNFDLDLSDIPKGRYLATVAHGSSPDNFKEALYDPAGTWAYIIGVYSTFLTARAVTTDIAQLPMVDMPDKVVENSEVVVTGTITNPTSGNLSAQICALILDADSYEIVGSTGSIIFSVSPYDSDDFEFSMPLDDCDGLEDGKTYRLAMANYDGVKGWFLLCEPKEVTYLNITSSISEVANHTEAPASWYNLQGIRLREPGAPGIYIKVGHDGSITKVVVD